MFTSERYQRQIIMPEVGVEGQEKIRSSTVLVIGAGGLGGSLLQYLVAAGVGKIGLVEADVVEGSNLHRQILFTHQDIGQSKGAIAKAVLNRLNPDVEIQHYNERFSIKNAYTLVQSYDIVVDGSDNFPTRYLVNDACVLLGKPFISGAVHRFEGQVVLLGLPDGPCYRCLYPKPPTPGLVANCAEEGVLGAVAGVIGGLMATETLRFLLGLHAPKGGELLQVDLKTFRFAKFVFSKNTACLLCGEAPEIFDLLENYEAFCGIPEQIAKVVTPAELHDWKIEGIDYFMLDVREPEEYAAGNMGGHLIPSGQLTNRLDELMQYRNKRVVVHCKSGGRSREATKLLLDAGFTDVWDIKGGFLAYLAFYHALDAFGKSTP
ncbi:MAG TPA: ThiF family adenylyltransferase [Rhodothermales bacterium]|nr:ThiF family adenylyltransferase [Rhodothermales bacterium]